MNLFKVLQKIPKRYILVILAFLGYFNSHILRANLSIAIVAMVYPTVEQFPNGTHTIIPPIHNWSSITQGVILSSVFYGFTVVQIPAGILAIRFGGSTLAGVGLGLSAFLTLFTPLCAQSGSTALIIIRIFQGFFGGFLNPCIMFVWAKWVPQCEAGSLIAFTLAGSTVGLFISLFLGGIIAQYWSWEWVFNLSGISGLIWALLWSYFIYETPSEHPTISDEELAHIRQNKVPPLSPECKIPWKDMLLSLPVWASIAVQIATIWTINIMVLELPTYLNQCLGYSLSLSGFWSAIPWILYGLMTWIAGFSSDKKQYWVKLVLFFIALYLAYVVMIMGSIIIVLAPKWQHDLILIGIFITLGFAGLAETTFGINQLDISGYYTGILLGISSTVASTVGMILPLFTGALVLNKTSQSEWNVVFMSSILIILVAWFFYIICASGELQPWAQNIHDECHPILESGTMSINIQEQQTIQDKIMDTLTRLGTADDQSEASQK